MSQLTFTKMHGLGNDFVVLEGPLSLSPKTIATLCDRHIGIGADGLMIVSPLNNGVRMEYWNADGSVAEMCGNGLRCVARFAIEHKLVKPGKFSVETAVGSLKVDWSGDRADLIEVQVGKVTTDAKPIIICDTTFYTASVGNPHAITFVDSSDQAPVKSLGPQVETDQYFPNKTNVEFAEVIDDSNVRLRIWERGVGETLACGTGMVATAVVASKLGKTKFPLTIEVPGGSSKTWIDEDGFMRLSGPAQNVFSGSVEI
ncbi:MAG: diaminopimelate epimerase [Patescibacteria group bacterium]